MNCGCDNRRHIMTQGEWRHDAGIIGAATVLVILSHGGSMSNSTKRLMTIAFSAAVIAVVVDGVLKPRLP